LTRAGANIHANTSGNPCPDGQLFTGSPSSDSFSPVNAGNADLVYSVTIV
jgi:hypothetical protein